jgi:uncharacterized protein YutE (UPF0331/DUF86 family)
VVDKVLILRKLTELSEYMDQIKEYRSLTVDAYAFDWKTQRIVERTLQVMIEVCADIAGHIISDSGYLTQNLRGYLQSPPREQCH